MLLPARMAVINYLSTVKNADVKEIMEAMRPLYGKEKQFTEQMYLDHVMSLEANGLCKLVRYELDENGELSLRFEINDDGRATVEKYVPAKFRTESK